EREVDAAGEQLTGDVDTETQSAQAHFTETAAAQAEAYDGFVQRIGESVEGLPFLTKDDAVEFGAEQTRAVNEMGDGHHAELDALEERTAQELEGHLVEGVERIDALGATSAEQAAATGSEKAAALRGIAERFAESTSEVSRQVATSM